MQSAFHWRWSSVVVFFAVWLVGQNVGIGMSYHRQLTHRGYATPKWLEYFMAACGTMALQGGPLYWVAVHRMHHQYTDKPGDPHSPRDGAWWSHMGWILNGSLHSDSKVLSRYAPDLAKDPVHQWLSKYHWVPVTTVGFGLLFGGAAFGGWACGISWVLWGVFLRVTIGMHVTWLVNSATHMWGSRRFETRDDSTNNWLVALLTGGEGWHNNHHAHPVSARHGMAWYEVDFNYMGIQLLQGARAGEERPCPGCQDSAGQVPAAISSEPTSQNRDLGSAIWCSCFAPAPDLRQAQPVEPDSHR